MNIIRDHTEYFYFVLLLLLFFFVKRRKKEIAKKKSFKRLSVLCDDRLYSNYLFYSIKKFSLSLYKL